MTTLPPIAFVTLAIYATLSMSLFVRLLMPPAPNVSISTARLFGLTPTGTLLVSALWFGVAILVLFAVTAMALQHRMPLQIQRLLDPLTTWTRQKLNAYLAC